MKFLLFTTSYTLYLTGDFVSHLFYIWGTSSQLYTTYNKLMSLSLYIDTKYELGVWDICS